MRTPYAGGDGGSAAMQRGKKQKTRQNEAEYSRIFCPRQSPRRIDADDPRSICAALLPAHGAQIDPQLLRLLIQVTALQAKSFCGQTHVVVAALQFRQNRLPAQRTAPARPAAPTRRTDAGWPAPDEVFGSAICTVARST